MFETSEQLDRNQDSIDGVALSSPISTISNSVSPVPFVSWAGSKRRLISQIAPYVTADFKRYVEPFLGGGSLFLYLQPQEAILNDVCSPLMETWKAVKADPDGVFREATRRNLDSESYYVARSERSGSQIEQAGRFIYLNKGAFNGLYRVNLKGEFNVPWGAPKSSFICNQANLQAVSHALSGGVELRSEDFETILKITGRGDLVFVDPPYVTSHNNNGFVEYNESIFSWEDQVRLSRLVFEAVDRGAAVVVTNANHSKIVDLYRGLKTVLLHRASTIAASPGKRVRVTELLFLAEGAK